MLHFLSSILNKRPNTLAEVTPNTKANRRLLQYKKEFKSSDETIAYLDNEMTALSRMLNEQRINHITRIDKGAQELQATSYRKFKLNEWVMAMRSASQPWGHNYQPNWVQLFDILANVALDPQVESCTSSLIEAILSKEPYVVDKDGDEDKEASKFVNRSWWEKWVTCVCNSKLWGFSLAQIESYDYGTRILKVKEVARKHVRPDLNALVKNQYDQKAWRSWDKAPYKASTVFNFSSSLGKLNRAVRYYIYKTDALSFWAEFNAVLARPRIMGKTETEDEKRKQQMNDALDNFHAVGWMVLDVNDSVEPLDVSKTLSTAEYFENLIRLANEEISIALLGSRLVTQEGSSRSLGEVHERNTNNIKESYERTVLYSSNEEMLPKLAALGTPIREGYEVRFREADESTMLDKAKVLSAVTQNYTLAAKAASEFIGLPLEEKETELDTNDASLATQNKVYKDMLNRHLSVSSGKIDE